MRQRFVNNFTGQKQEVGDVTVFIWTLLFGPIYFAFKGAWWAAFFSFALAVVTWGWTHLLFPFFAKGIVIDSLRRNGFGRDYSTLGKDIGVGAPIHKGGRNVISRITKRPPPPAPTYGRTDIEV